LGSLGAFEETLGVSGRSGRRSWVSSKGIRGVGEALEIPGGILGRFLRWFWGLVEVQGGSWVFWGPLRRFWGSREVLGGDLEVSQRSLEVLEKLWRSLRVSEGGS